MNPGGPGVSGYDVVAESVDFAVTEAVQDRYDIVGFDPRGVGRSTAVECLEPAELDQLLFGIPPGSRGSNSWITGQNELTHSFGQACLANTGALLANVDTVSAARDLDLLRAILGEEQLDYLGYSYGAYLGTVYAGTYPDKVGRLVLDGAIDPGLSEPQITLAQAQGLETALRSYLAACIPAATCPFQGTVDDGDGDGARHPRCGRRRTRSRRPTAARSAPTPCSSRSRRPCTTPRRGRRSTRCSPPSWPGRRSSP